MLLKILTDWGGGTVISIKGRVTGKVQGVGFRYFTQQHAIELNVAGYAKNCNDGSVEFLLMGNEQSVNKMLEFVKVGPQHALVKNVQFEKLESIELAIGFQIG